MPKPQTKRCSRCRRLRPVSRFYVHDRNGSSTRLQAACIPCSNAYRVRYFKNNRSRELAAHRAYTKSVRKKFHAFLSTQACVDCDEDDPVVLEFDHVRGKKVAAVGTLLGAGKASWATIEREIKKC